MDARRSRSDDSRKGAQSEEDRGRGAHRPLDVPAAGWWDILWRTKDQVSQNQISLIAAGIAFYALLALFPAIATIIALWGLFADPGQIEEQIAQVSHLLPTEAAEIVTSQVQSVASGAGGGLTLAVIGGLLLSFYSSSRGVTALMGGLNVAYDEEEQRGIVKQTLVAFGLSIAIVVGLIVAVVVTIVMPLLFGALGLGDAGRFLVTVLRWPLLFVFVVLGLAVIYRYAPDRNKPRWNWISPGAIFATLLWIVASIGFSIYVRNFASYNETYGSIGAVIILLMWLWLSAFIVLLGAEINAEMERQTKTDTTVGKDKPMGEREAYAADTIGESR